MIILLFLEFLKIGLFSIGGGLATLPFLYQLADKYDWFTQAMIGDMIAVSESTPGPLGVNMATYTGFLNMGVLGALVATIGLVLPSVIIIILVSKCLEKFRNSKVVEQIFYAIRPTVTGLIGAAGFLVIIGSLFPNGVALGIGMKQAALFIIMFFLIKKWEIHPLFYILLAATIGIIFKF